MPREKDAMRAIMTGHLIARDGLITCRVFITVLGTGLRCGLARDRAEPQVSGSAAGPLQARILAGAQALEQA